MSEKLVWMNPESFAEHFLSNPALLSATIDVRYSDEDAVGLDIACKVSDMTPITLDELKLVQVCWKNGINCAAHLSEYVQIVQTGGSHHVEFPFVDKKHLLIFDMREGTHEVLAMSLFEAYEGWEAAPYELRGPEYILRGCGYYLSSICQSFYVGKVLFDNNALTEDDAFILEDRAGVIETIHDFHRIKRRGY